MNAAATKAFFSAALAERDPEIAEAIALEPASVARDRN